MKNNNTNNIKDFLRYNNAVPLLVAIAVVVSGSAFAATPTGQEAISQTVVGKTEKVISVDNTYIAGVDLNIWTPKARVTGVSEDSDFYYVSYILSTIDIKDYKWQNVDEDNSLKVDKNFLKEYKSLEDYVKYELSQKIDSEKDRLARTQEIEKKNVTQKQVVTSYTGLAGLVIDDKTTVEDPTAPAPESLTPGPVNNTVAPTPVVQTTDTQNTQTNNVDNTSAATTTTDTTNTTTTTTATTTPVIDTSVLTNATSTDTSATSTPATTTPAADTTPTPVPTPTPLDTTTQAPAPASDTTTQTQ